MVATRSRPSPAWLHDAIEDAGAEQEAVIAERFGPRVAGIVTYASVGPLG